MLILALLAAAQTAAGPSDVTSFGDWAVACDNLRFCEAASLMADDNVENPPQIAIMREGGPAGALAIEVAPDAEYRGGYRLEIDGRTVLVGTLNGPSLVVGGDAGRTRWPRRCSRGRCWCCAAATASRSARPRSGALPRRCAISMPSRAASAPRRRWLPRASGR
jgi:hypothetical protein